ncbi:MAG: hypothetical protein WBA57_23730, partial [Elainellaceae cyanobacterium]
VLNGCFNRLFQHWLGSSDMIYQAANLTISQDTTGTAFPSASLNAILDNYAKNVSVLKRALTFIVDECFVQSQ